MATRSNGLYTKVEHPLPGTAKSSCYVYGTTGAGVDLGVLIDFEGSLYLSNAAIKEAAEVAGFLVNEEGLQLEQDNAFLGAENAELRRTVIELSEQLDAVSIVLARAKKAR